MSAAARAGFAAALSDPALPAPGSLASTEGARPDKRFAVYRNNVAVGLIGALETRFPVTRRIVGEAFFAELARAFARTHPPRSPVMMRFGDDLAGFAETLPALAELPYLPDVIRLEAARTRAYHAADATPLSGAAFATIDPETLGDVVIALHPSLEIVRSAHPIVTIWAMNAGEAELGPIADWRPQDALVVRPVLDVTIRTLPPGGAAFLEALGRGLSLAEAAEAAVSEAEAFDLTKNLVGMIEAGIAVGVRQPRQMEPRP
jgi:hypothetical protein